MRRVLALLCALVASIATARALDWPGTETVRQKLETALVNEIGGTARVGKVTLHPLDGAVEVADVEVHPDRGSLTRLTLEHGRVRLSLTDLLAGRLRLLEIEAAGVDAALHATGGPPRPRVKPLFDVQVLSRLERIAISNGVFHHEDQAIRFSIDVRGIRIDSSGNVPVLGGEMVAGPLQFEASGVPLQHIEHVRLRWTWKAPRIGFEIVEARGSSGTFTGRGLVSLTQFGLLATGQVEGAADVQTVMADPNAPVRGHVAVKASFRAVDPGITEIRGTLTADGPLEVAGVRCTTASAEFHLGPQGIDLSDGRATLPGGTVVESFAYHRAKSDAWTVRATGDADIQEMLQLVKAGHRADQVRGRAQFTFDAAAASSHEVPHWTMTASARATGITRGALTGQLEGRGDAGGGRVTMKGALDLARLDIDFSWPSGGLASHWTVDGRFDADPGRPAETAREDLLRYLADEGIDLPKGTIPFAGGAFTLGVRFEGRGSDLLLGDLPFRLESPSYGTVRLDRLEGRVGLGPHGTWEVTFRLADATGHGLDGRLAGARGVPVSVDAHADRVPLDVAREYAIGAFGLPIPESQGTLDGFVTGHLAYGIRDLTVGATLRGRVARSPEVTLEIGGRIRGDVADLRLAHLEAPGLASDFTGIVQLPGGLLPWGISGQLAADADIGRLLRASGAPGNAGRLTLRTDIAFAGTDKPLIANGDVRWRGLEVADVPVPEGGARLLPMDDGTLFVLDSPGWQGEVRLTGPVEDPHIATHLVWIDLHLMEFLSVINRRPIGVGLNILTDGEVDLDGQLRTPGAWRGRARVARIDVLGASLDGRLEKPVDLLFNGDGWVRAAGNAPLVIVGSSGGRLSVTGAASMFGPDAGTLDLRVDGTADLSIAEIFDPDLVGAGSVTAAITLGGTFHAPRIEGQVKVANGRLRLLPYTDAIDRLSAQIDFGPRLVTISKGSFGMGGGDVTFFGTMMLDAWRPGRIDLNVRARAVALNIPKGVWGRYNADLKVQGQATEPEIAGDIVMLAGRYTKPFTLETVPGTRVRKVEPTTSRSHWITRVGLRLHLTGADALAIRNDTAQMQAALALDLSGDLGQVLMAGTVVLVEGGRLQFRGIDYEVVSGQIIFDDPRGEPMRFRIRLTTDVRTYSVRLEIDATPETLDYQLTSTPALSRTDILALLLTGQTPEELAGGSQQVTTELATSYFGTQLGEFLLANPVRRLFGVTRFQISPSVVGAETRPTARVTFGRRVDDKTSVLYSRDLSAEGRDLYRIERELSRQLRIAVGREPLGGVAVDFRWLQRLGEGAAEPEGNRAPRLVTFDISGVPTGVKIRGRDLGLKTGARTRRFQIIQAQETLRRLLVQAGYFEADVTRSIDRVGPAIKSKRGDEAVLEFKVVPGPHWDVAYEGSGNVEKRVRQILAELWGETQFRPDDHREAVRVVREGLADDGYATAVVDIRRPDPNVRKLVVSVDAGPRAHVAHIAFEGVHALSESDLMAQVLSRPASLLSQLPSVLGTGAVYRPRVASEDADAIRTLYGQDGYLETKVEPRARFRGEGEEVVVTFVVDEGPRAKIGSVRVDGDWPDALGPAVTRTGLKTGEPFTPNALKSAESVLRGALDSAGYYEARIATRPEVQQGVVNIVFRVRAGRSATVDSIEYVGLRKTKRKVLEEATKVEVGKPLSAAGLRRTESELFRLGVFRRVEITTEPAGDDPSRRRVIVHVEENPRLSLLTSLGYDTEERYRGSISLSNDNLWGLGRTGSVQAYASSIRSGLRATLEDRRLRGGSLEGLFTVGLDREDRGGFVLQSTGVALQLATPPRQQTRYQFRYELSDNRFSNVTLDPDAIAQILRDEGRRLSAVRLGGLLASVIKDRRDDPFVPTRGWFARTEVGFWNTALLSQADFARITGEIAGYQPHGRLTLAGAVRFGLAWPLGRTGAVPLSERFFAGGADSLRGFPRDKVGPLDMVGGDPLGGEALLVTNLEARYRVWGSLSMMTFYDVGNVWAKAAEFYTGKLRKAAGLGVRYTTPVGALRLEYGWKLDRQEGESPGQFFLSIGEAF